MTPGTLTCQWCGEPITDRKPRGRRPKYHQPPRDCWYRAWLAHVQTNNARYYERTKAAREARGSPQPGG